MGVEMMDFKKQTLQSAIELMRKDAFMESIDFKDAYYTIPIHQDLQKYLCFWWQGQKYQYGCLPNCLLNGPRDFTKVTKVLLRALKTKCFTLTSYIDDNFLIEQEFNRCLQNIIETAQMSIKAGFVINWEKSVLIPTQQLTYLGFILDTVEKKIRLTQEQISELKTLISGVIKLDSISLLGLSQFVGKLVATFPGVKFGKLYYRQLDIEKNAGLKLHKGNFHKSIVLSTIAHSDLKWWLQNLDNAYEKASSSPPSITVTCDACTNGVEGGGGGLTGQEQKKGNLLKMKWISISIKKVACSSFLS